MIAGLLTACAGNSAPFAQLSTPTPAASETPAPPTVTPLPPTATAVPTEVVYSGPAAKYLPSAQDFPDIYEAEPSIVSQNAASQLQIPVDAKNKGFASFKNKGEKSLSGIPQDGVYFLFTYWVVVAPDEASASFLYQASRQPAFIKQGFVVIAPAAVLEDAAEFSAVPPGDSPCSQADIRILRSDPYASFREGKLPTRDPRALKPVNPAVLANLPPDLYISAACRVKNALVFFWGYTMDNVDGRNNPIPAAEIAAQVKGFLEVITNKLK